ncbi:MAG: hypothetical protein ACK6DB_10590, partial [Planctomycetota bacterium]
MLSALHPLVPVPAFRIPAFRVHLFDIQRLYFPAIRIHRDTYSPRYVFTAFTPRTPAAGDQSASIAGGTQPDVKHAEQVSSTKINGLRRVWRGRRRRQHPRWR